MVEFEDIVIIKKRVSIMIIKDYQIESQNRKLYVSGVAF